MPRPDVSQERKAQILQAALELFSQSGYEAASMNDLAARCNLSKAAIYHYFDSKDAILLALTESIFQADTRELLALEQSPLPAEERLRTYMQSLVEAIQALKPLHGMFMEFYSQATRTDAIRGHLQRYYDQYERTLTTLTPHLESPSSHLVLTIAASREAGCRTWLAEEERVEEEVVLQTTLLRGGVRRAHHVAHITLY